ncbi:MAG: putative LPS assembly protein LptD, partial [Bacteroidales bacterium]
KVEMDINKNELSAKGVRDSTDNYKGKPKFKQGTDEFTADSLKYNIETKRGFAFGIITKQEDGYLHSEHTKIMEDKRIYVKNGKFTTCDLEHPHFYVAMSKAKIVPEKQIVTGPAYLVIEDIPLPLVIPFGFFPTKRGRASGVIIPTFGEDQDQGFYMRNGGVYFGINDYIDLKLLGDFYTLGSWRTFVNSNYVKRYKFYGNFDFTFSSLVFDELRQKPSYNINWNHRQDPKARPNSNFNANVNYGAAGHNRYNARNTDEYLNTSIRSSVSYDKKFPNTPLRSSLNFTHNQNNLDSTISLSLPYATFSMSSLTPFKRKTTIGKPKIYENIRVSISSEFQNKLTNAKMDSTFYTQKTLDQFQRAFRHTIPVSTSIKFLKYFSLNPMANFTERWYFDKITKQWDDNLPVYSKTDTTYGGVRVDTIKQFNRVYDISLSAGVSFKIYGMYALKNKTIRAVRHVLTPTVNFSWRPDYGRKHWGYYSWYIDSKGRVQPYSYFENGMYGVPGRGKFSTLNISLSNNLEMKVRNRKDTTTFTRKITLIEDFGISGSYNFAADSLKMSYINVYGRTNILRRVNVRYMASFDPYVVTMDNRYKTIVRTNTYMYDKYGRPWRIENSQWEVSTGLQLGPLKDRPKNQEKKYATYSEFKPPWSLSFNYTLSLPRKYFYNEMNLIDSVDSRVVQTLSFYSNFKITNKWSVRFNSGWDFENNKITYTTIDIVRDLHCWEMKFNWIPFGRMQRYEFLLHVKARIFQDLKVEKKQNYGDVFY